MQSSFLHKRIYKIATTLLLIISFNTQAQTWNYVGSSTGISASASSFNNIASDGTNPVIAYATGDIINGSNVAKKYNGSSWSNFGSSPGFGSGHTYELKLTMDGTTPYAAWQDDWYNYYIVAAKFNGTSWQVLGNPGFSQGQVFSIDMTVSGGTPYVVYKDGTFGQITVQKFDGTSWGNVGSARFTPAIASSIISPKIVVNGSTPYVFFGDNATYGGKARLVKYDGTNWVNVGTPGFSIGTITATKLYFVGSTPYVAFTEQSANTYIKTMKYDGTNWVVVNNAQFTSNSSSSLCNIEMNDTVPYVVFSDANNSNKLSVKKFNGTSWVAVGTQGFSAASVSQAAITFVNKVPYVSFNNAAASNKVVVMKFDCTIAYGTKDVAVCSSNLPYNFNGKSINAAGSYNDTLIAGNSNGCDSITTLNLTIDNSICFKWATRFGGKSQDDGKAIVTDVSGNVYTTGTFYDTASFGSTDNNNITQISATIPNGNVFISKHDKDGKLAWVKQLGGTSYSTATDIILDAANNIYVTGYFYATVDFDPSAAVYNLTNVVGVNAGFFAKYDANGNFVWAKMLTGANATYPYSIKLDNANNVYVGGVFGGGTDDFDPGAATYNIATVGGYDGFIAKYNNNGDFIWAKTIGGLNDDFINKIALDANNNVYATGYFLETCDFDPSPTATANLTVAAIPGGGNIDAYLLKLDANGNFVYVKQIGGTDYEEGSRIAVDAANNIYIGGIFAGSTDFDPGAAVYNLSSNGGNTTGQDVFITKYTSAGNMTWTKAIGNIEVEYIQDLKVVKDAIYFSGLFSGTVDFNPNAAVNNLTAAGVSTTSDAFVVKWDTASNYVWARAFGGESNDFANAVAIDNTDNVYVTGVFQSTTDLSGIGLSAYQLTSYGQRDGFIIKLGPPSSTWYLDADGDGYGNGTQNAASSPGTGWSTTVPANGSTDCDDNNNQVWRSANLFIDADNDGYTNGTATLCYGATVPNGYKASSLGTDCNDNLFNATAPVVTTSTTTVSNCGSYVWNGTTYTSSGSYNIHLTNAAGCDSAATLNLTVNSSSTSTTNTSICSTALPYSWNGLTFNAAGSQTAHLTNAAGCDSAATLNLTVKANYTITASAGANGSISNAGVSTICSGNNQSYTITPNGGYYVSDVLVDGASIGAITSYTFTSVTANHTIAATFGLTCVPTSSTTNKSICQSSFPYNWNGNSYSQVGTYTVHFTNAAGCDSAANLVLTINNNLPPITGANAVCVGGVIQLTNAELGGTWSSVANRATINATGAVTGTSAGTAVIKYSKVGCVAVSKNITVTAIAATPTIAYAPHQTSPQANGGVCKNKTFTLVGNPAGGIWSSSGVLNITNAGVVTTGNTTGAGSVTYTIAASGCGNSRTINTNVVACKGMNNQQLTVDSRQLIIYPNPTRSAINLNIKTSVDAGTIVVTDLYGKQLRTQSLSMGVNTIDVSSFAKGMYLVSVITEQGKQTQKVVVE